LIDLNATQAAIRTGYSPKTADVQGPRLLGNVRLAAAIAEGKARQLEAADLSAAQVLAATQCIAFSDIAETIDELGHLRAIHTLPKHVRLAIKSIKVTKKNLTPGDGLQEDVVELEFWDKLKALHMFCQHFGLLRERLEVTGQLSLLEKVNRARQRVAALKGGKPSDDEPPESSKQ
jgi:phage terminase small subunit